ETDAPGKQVEKAAHAPERIAVVPAVAAAEPSNGCERLRRRNRTGAHAGVHEPAAHLVAARLSRALARAERVRPTRLRDRAVRAQDRARDRLPVAAWPDREALECARVEHDRLVRQALD